MNKTKNKNIQGFDVALFEERIEKNIKWNKDFGFNIVYDNYLKDENVDFYVYLESKKNMGLTTNIESLDELEKNIKIELKKSLEKMILKCNKFLDELNKNNEKEK